MALDGVKENLETAENDLKKEKENREEDKLNFEAAKNELETLARRRGKLGERSERDAELTKKLAKRVTGTKKLGG